MAKLSKEEVLKLAYLARLDLTEFEVEEFRTELSNILTYVEQLKNVDTDQLSPTNQVTGLTNVMRDDKLIDYGYQPKKLLENVPFVKDEQIKVKRMVG
jgi:aspartyl-tRNA(Asn)/glutamyl-tRNA(Gln) amidotransferase subunit C